MKKNSFGQPKPLPGQKGYKVSTTELLEKESREMEMRLKALQEKMQTQQSTDQNMTQTGGGGSRWKSARTDKGGLSSYAKDVQEKIKQKTMRSVNSQRGSSKDSSENLNMRSVTEISSISNLVNPIQITNFHLKDISAWTITDVSEWLACLNLTNYAEIFQQNEITGPVLLEISLEDLDYMGITILGHRKLLLKGIPHILLKLFKIAHAF
jgi:hypothetical protein